MKILLDECVPQEFCKCFPNHECQPARHAGFGGKKNGELLMLAEQAGFDALITVDKGLPYQQNFEERTISLVLIGSRSNRLPDLLAYVPACLEVLRNIQPGQVLRVGD